MKTLLILCCLAALAAGCARDDASTTETQIETQTVTVTVTQPEPTTDESTAQTETVRDDDVSEFVAEFYDAYVEAVNSQDIAGATAELVDAYGTTRLNQQVARAVDHDPVLCAQNVPRRVEVTSVAATADLIEAKVTLHWGGGMTTQNTVVVTAEADGLLIDSVECPS